MEGAEPPAAGPWPLVTATWREQLEQKVQEAGRINPVEKSEEAPGPRVVLAALEVQR